MPQPSPFAGLEPIARDTVCLRCGYNLRGLSGDPVRCPECGSLNPRDDVRVRDEEISRELLAMETWPAACVGATLLFLAMTGLSVALWIAGMEFRPFVIAALATIGLWVWGYRRYRAACQEAPGCVDLFVRYQLTGVGAVLGLCVVGAIGFAIKNFLSFLGPLVYVVVGASLLIVNFAVAHGPYARLRAEMDVVQHAVAEEIVRERFRRSIFRGALSWKSSDP
ncbi:MAG: hypothetical protein HUU22_08215 [Phycisphaerae bacterium]|nr:hypothetical protein [Phycisphaerae bacterium]NUQ46003.1 hypothetical protein [Phycisphaerae bacterium]